MHQIHHMHHDDHAPTATVGISNGKEIGGGWRARAATSPPVVGAGNGARRDPAPHAGDAGAGECGRADACW